MKQPSATVTSDRNSTHGSFDENARISQELKNVIRSCDGELTDAQREALDMICLKLSRILSGHANFKDHWTDISGYAQLVEKHL